MSALRQPKEAEMISDIELLWLRLGKLRIRCESRLLKIMKFCFSNTGLWAVTRPLVLFCLSRMIARDMRWVMSRANAQQIQELGREISQSENPDSKEFGKTLETNAEKIILFRVFRRWIAR